MLSIAIFSECYHPMRNGVVVSVSSFARELTARGHRVTIFTAHHPEQQGEEAGVLRYPSLDLPVRVRYPIPLPIPSAAIQHALRTQPFDLIHANSPMVLGHVALTVAHRRRLPLILTYHTMLEEYSHYFPLPDPWFRRCAINISRRFANAADHVLTPSAHVAHRLRDYGVNRPITAIPTGIDIEQIDATPPADSRAHFGIPPDVPLLACAGRIAIEKNLPRLLSAFRRVLRAEPNAHLLLIGGGPYEDHLRALIAEYRQGERVHITGFVPREQVIQGLRAADLFVFASKTETQGLVLGEAMTCGLPVVAVDADAEREIITPEVEGLLTPDDDAPFADAVLALLHDVARRRCMGAAARRRAETISAARCTERLLAVYRQVLDARADHEHAADASVGDVIG